MATPREASAFYLATFLVYAVTLYYDWVYIEIGHSGYAGKFKYLTFWNLVSVYQSALHFTEDHRPQPDCNGGKSVDKKINK